jgi:hypothetical protein
MKIAALVLLLVGCAAAAGLDGRWTAEVHPAGKKAAAVQTASFRLDLKTDGGQLTGSVVSAHGRKALPMAIVNGRLDGDRFTFTTVQHGKKGDVTFNWQGTVTGDQISGTRNRNGAKHGAGFTAKRQG